MKIGVTSYPMLWQRTGGLQVQIRQTIASLRREGVEVEIVDPVQKRLADYDLIHVYSATHGMHLTIEEARLQGVKTVVSPVFQPDFNPLRFFRFNLANWVVRQLSGNAVKTSHAYISSALQAADHVIALSDIERRVITRGYGIDDAKVSVVPNGIDTGFFEATAELCIQGAGMQPGFVLVVGSISSFKNQLAVIRATDADVVLVGQILDPAYFQQCQVEAGSRLKYLGTFDYADPMLGSIYAAAGVTVLASQGEAFGLSVVESLAAGTPAIITANNGLGISAQPPLLQFVTSQDRSMLRKQINAALSLSEKPVNDCRKLVCHLEWSSVSKSLAKIYTKLLKYDT